MKTTASAGACAKSARQTVLPLVSGKRKSGAAVPSASMVEGVRDIPSSKLIFRAASSIFFREPAFADMFLVVLAGTGGHDVGAAKVTENLARMLAVHDRKAAAIVFQHFIDGVVEEFIGIGDDGVALAGLLNGKARGRLV